MKDRIRRMARESRGLLIFLGLMFCFRTAVADWMVVPSGSMNPTLMEGDYILVQKTRYGLHVPFTDIRLTEGLAPQRGEIAVFHSPVKGTTLVKRVIGVPGDHVALRDERLFVNGEAAVYEASDIDFRGAMLAEWADSSHRIERERFSGVEHYMMVQPDKPAARSFETVTVPDGMYLVLGDNRDNSADSRYIGFVPRDAFIGRATRVVVSFNPDDYLLPRLSRTLAPLQ